MVLERRMPEAGGFKQKGLNRVRLGPQDLRDIDAVMRGVKPQYPDNEYLSAMDQRLTYITDEYKTDDVEDLLNYPKASIDKLTVRLSVDFWIFTTSRSTILSYTREERLAEAARKIEHILRARAINQRLKKFNTYVGVPVTLALVVLTTVLLLGGVSIPPVASGIIIFLVLIFLILSLQERPQPPVRLRNDRWIDKHATLAMVLATVAAAVVSGTISAAGALIATRS